VIAVAIPRDSMNMSRIGLACKPLGPEVLLPVGVSLTVLLIPIDRLTGALCGNAAHRQLL